MILPRDRNKKIIIIDYEKSNTVFKSISKRDWNDSMNERILVVDDEIINRKVIKGVLLESLKDVILLEAENGNEALNIIFNTEITVIILDIMMPEKDGIEVLKEIKSNIKTKYIPVIMYSALHDNDTIKKSLSLGALDYFSKPLTSEQMHFVIPLKVRNAIEFYRNKKELIKYCNHIKQELKLAEQLQRILVNEYQSNSLAEMWTKYMPCEEVGGDVCCFKKVDNKCWFMIADISGHGVTSAMISMMINVLFNTLVDNEQSPDNILDKINKSIFDILGSRNSSCVSSLIGCISKDTLYFSNAGHPYPYIYRNETKKVDIIKSNGLLLGAFENINPELNEIDINSGDIIVLYTDGLFDKGINKGFSNWNLIKDYIEDNINIISSNSKEFIDNMANNFNDLEQKRFIDDVAIMIIKKK